MHKSARFEGSLADATSPNRPPTSAAPRCAATRTTSHHATPTSGGACGCCTMAIAPSGAQAARAAAVWRTHAARALAPCFGIHIGCSTRERKPARPCGRAPVPSHSFELNVTIVPPAPVAGISWKTSGRRRAARRRAWCTRTLYWRAAWRKSSSERARGPEPALCRGWRDKGCRASNDVLHTP